MHPRSWLPAVVDVRVRIAAWVTLIAQIGIVGTGGLVRLTGSGLGCPTWPECTDGSLITTPAAGIHGMIEFGNRLLTFALVIIAVGTFLLVWRMRHQRRDLFWLALLVGMYIPVQAILGGITVLTKLNPYVVGAHFLVSVPIVALSTALVTRVYATPGQATPTVPRWYSIILFCCAGIATITVIVGIVLTGSGPHAGDAHAIRNGLNPEIMQHIHADCSYVLFGLTVIAFAAAFRTSPPLRMTLWVGLLLATEFFQMIIGLIQANTGLPIALVNIHMVLAMIVVATMTSALMHRKSHVYP